MVETVMKTAQYQITVSKWRPKRNNTQLRVRALDLQPSTSISSEAGKAIPQCEQPAFVSCSDLI